jgi:hypothetical protein
MANERPAPISSPTDEWLRSLFEAEGLLIPDELRTQVWQEAHSLKDAATRLRDSASSPFRTSTASR